MRKTVCLWVAAAAAVVVALCALDLRCSGKPGGGSVVARVRGEMDAGKEAFAQIRLDQVCEQLRMARQRARELAQAGDARRTREALKLVRELEEQRARLEARATGKENGK